MSGTLLSAYEGIVCDLDGVVYRGPSAVPHAVDALGAARAGGTRIVYATNNASRTPGDVAGHLAELGLDLDVADVVTSSQAGAVHLASVLDPGSPVLAVGGEGVGVALEAAGLRPVRTADVADLGRPVAAVLQGLGKDVTWRDLAEAAFAIQGGAAWVATNADLTLPEARGLAPGNGALVGVVREAVDVDPLVVGKPETPLYELAADVLHTPVDRVLAVGDRLDTDLQGAVSTGMDGLFVLTGVSRLRDVALADERCRPRYVVLDLRALHEPYAEPVVDRSGDGARAVVGDARATLTSGRLDVEIGTDPTGAARALVAAAWSVLDAGGDLDVDAQAWARAEADILAAHDAGGPR